MLAFLNAEAAASAFGIIISLVSIRRRRSDARSRLCAAWPPVKRLRGAVEWTVRALRGGARSDQPLVTLMTQLLTQRAVHPCYRSFLHIHTNHPIHQADRQYNRDIPATPTTFFHAAPPRHVRARGRARRGSPLGRMPHYRAGLLTLYGPLPPTVERPRAARDSCG